MAARFSYKDMDSSRLPVKLYEGTITKADVIGPDGLIVEDTITYQYPLEKGDLVSFYSDANSGGEIVVQKVTLGSDEVNNAAGIIIDTPMGNDAVTATSGAPAHAQRRSATIKCFGDPIIHEFDATDAGAIRAMYSVLFSEAAPGVIEGSATLANGDAVAMAYTAASGIVPVLMGYSGFHPKD
jgi:hypothetical protein